MVSSRYEPVRADTAARPWLPRQVLPLQCTEVPGNRSCVSLQPRGEKYSLFFPDYGLLEISFESPFADDLLKYCLATKPYANNVLSPVLAFY